jgi:hypothetical protein
MAEGMSRTTRCTSNLSEVEAAMGSGGNNEHIQNLVLRWGIILK